MQIKKTKTMNKPEPQGVYLLASKIKNLFNRRNKAILCR